MSFTFRSPVRILGFRSGKGVVMTEMRMTWTVEWDPAGRQYLKATWLSTVTPQPLPLAS